MKPKTRDNIVYLVVALSIAAALATDVFYAVTHDQEIIVPPAYLMRASGMMLVTGYFVVRELRKRGVAVASVMVYGLVTCALQSTIGLGLRQRISQLSGLTFVVLVTIETFVVVSLATSLASRFPSHQRQSVRRSG